MEKILEQRQLIEETTGMTIHDSIDCFMPSVVRKDGVSVFVGDSISCEVFRMREMKRLSKEKNVN